MDLIYEKDDLAVALDDFLNHPLQPFLEFSLILGPCDKGSHVQGIHEPVLEVLGHVTANNLLGYPFGNSGLAHPRLSHQDGVVLRTPAQDLEHAADFVVPADDRVEFPLGRQVVEVDGILA